MQKHSKTIPKLANKLSRHLFHTTPLMQSVQMGKNMMGNPYCQAEITILQIYLLHFLLFFKLKMSYKTQQIRMYLNHENLTHLFMGTLLKIDSDRIWRFQITRNSETLRSIISLHRNVLKNLNHRRHMEAVKVS